MIPCVYKYLFNLECFGCGFQRSVLALLDGRILLSIELFPGLIPLLIFLVLKLLCLINVWKISDFKRLNIVMNACGILSLCIQISTYCLRWIEVLPWTENIKL
jgi:hypothetical protein